MRASQHGRLHGQCAWQEFCAQTLGRLARSFAARHRPENRRTVHVRARAAQVVAGVNTSPDYVNPSGELKVIASGADWSFTSIAATIDLGGQPDSVAVSPDNKYIAVAIENERDEDLGDGAPPQMPAGYLSVIDTSLNPDPTTWTAVTVQLTDLPGCLYDTDPEPEYVSINAQNEAVITLQPRGNFTAPSC